MFRTLMHKFVVKSVVYASGFSDIVIELLCCLQTCKLSSVDHYSVIVDGPRGLDDDDGGFTAVTLSIITLWTRNIVQILLLLILYAYFFFQNRFVDMFPWFLCDIFSIFVKNMLIIIYIWYILYYFHCLFSCLTLSHNGYHFYCLITAITCTLGYITGFLTRVLKGYTPLDYLFSSGYKTSKTIIKWQTGLLTWSCDYLITNDITVYHVMCLSDNQWYHDNFKWLSGNGGNPRGRMWWCNFDNLLNTSNKFQVTCFVTLELPTISCTSFMSKSRFIWTVFVCLRLLQ